jgi:hypothetical protein
MGDVVTSRPAARLVREHMASTFLPTIAAIVRERDRIVRRSTDPWGTDARSSDGRARPSECRASTPNRMATKVCDIKILIFVEHQRVSGH